MKTIVMQRASGIWTRLRVSKKEQKEQEAYRRVREKYGVIFDGQHTAIVLEMWLMDKEQKVDCLK